MSKTILITGSTDGIGLATAASLLKLGHKVLLHGRSENKIADAKTRLIKQTNVKNIESYCADLSNLNQVRQLAKQITEDHSTLDIVINNAGIFKTANPITADNFDVRFVVNTIAPYLLTKLLLPVINNDGRVINLSSAAQAPVCAQELLKPSQHNDNSVYAKSKLALTMWTKQLANELGQQAPAIIAINPKSFLGSKMVQQAYGMSGSDLQQGADILVKAALSADFANATGMYFDNDIGQFAAPHPDALDESKNLALIQMLNLNFL